MMEFIRGGAKSTFFRNWSFLTISSLIGQVISIFTGIRIARTLAPAGYGQFGLVLVQAGLVGTIINLGFRLVTTRMVARQPEQSAMILFVTSSVRSVVLLIVCLGLLLYNRFSASGLSFQLVQLIIILVIGSSLWDLVEGIAFGHQRMEYSASINLVGSVAWLVWIYSVPRAWLTPYTVSLSTVMLQLIKAFIYAWVGIRTGYFQGRVVWASYFPFAKDLLVQSLPFYWLSLLTASTNQLPILFLGGRSGETEVGLYNVGFRLMNPMQMVLITALTALYPGLSKAGKYDEEKFQRTVQQALLGITLLGTMAALIISLFRNEVILFLFGNAYLKTADALAYQSWYTAIYALFCLIGTVLAARDKQNWLAMLSTGYTIVSLPILWWGAGHGASGLAMAIVGGAILNMSYHWIVFQRSLPKPVSLPFNLMLLSILVSGMLIAWLVPQQLHWALRSLIMAIALIALSFPLKNTFLQILREKRLLPLTGAGNGDQGLIS